MDRIQNLHVGGMKRLITPLELKRQCPGTHAVSNNVADARATIQRILGGEDARPLVVVGPCSVHDTKGALEYAGKLAKLAKTLKDKLFIVMRVYFEKPRTSLGWKGLINDPALDGSCDIEKGLGIARKLLVEINAMGLPAATEFLDPIIPQYISDLIAWAAVGARTTESQTHREMASGFSMPVGFKNSTDGSLQTAVDAMRAARSPHSFLGIDQQGFTSIVRTTGNPWGHVVLRGGHQCTNFDPASIAQAVALLEKAGMHPAVMVDCSHANSEKKPARQEVVWKSVMEQRAQGQKGLIGLMVESYLEAGNQPFPQPVAALRYGVSITDPCLDWESTAKLLSS
jgi:3-deoxy-7-phosphoheptulonate synthase